MSAGISAEAEEKAAPADTQKITPKLTWLDTLSDANLEKFAKVSAITLEEIEISGINRLTYNKIDPAPYQRAGFGFDEVRKILGKIGIEESGVITVSNDELKRKISGKEFMTHADNVPSKKDYLETFSLTEDDLDNYLIVSISTLDITPILKSIWDHIYSKISIHPEVLEMKNKAQLIKNFSASKIDNMPSNVKIYLLKVFYSYYENILSTYYGSGLFFTTSGIDELNDYFKILRKKIIKLIESDTCFSEIKDGKAYKTIIEQITSLYSSMDFFDGVWEDFTRPLIVDLREEIADKDLFENGSEIQKTDMATAMFLEATANEIEKLNKLQKQQEKNFYEKEVPKYKKDFEGAFGKKSDQTIKHEHVHRFDNSIQEKDIVLNHKFEKSNEAGFYITQKGDDFYYKGRYLELSKKAEYYKVFCSLFAKLPEGGEIKYKDLAEEIKNRIPKTKGKTDEEMRKFIQGNLTDRNNGFLRYAEIPITEDNGKPLFEILRGTGITFNNKRG